MAKTEVLDVSMQLQLIAEETAAYNGIDAEIRVRITREIKMKTNAFKFNLISGFHLKAGFKAEVRASLMKKGQLTPKALVKAEAMQIELILEERKKNQLLAQWYKTRSHKQVNDNYQDNVVAIRKNG
jgi:hypothetical protein